MLVQAENAGDQIKRLQHCINDLVSLLALPATWSDSEPSQIVHSLLDALMRLLSLDLVYIRFNDAVAGISIEKVRVAPGQPSMPGSEEICSIVGHCFAGNPFALPSVLRQSIGDQDIGFVPLQLGLHGEIGLIVTGSQRADFPN
jgi:hypothetical protein